MDRIRMATDKAKRQDIPAFVAGDTLKVHSIIKETDAKGVEKQRVKSFQGVCIKKHNAGISSTFTVRKISDGVGVERIYPVHSPMITKVEVVNKGSVRRANLSYFKKLTGKAARIKKEEEVIASTASVATKE